MTNLRTLSVALFLASALAIATGTTAHAQVTATTEPTPTDSSAAPASSLTDRPFFVGAGLGFMSGFDGGLAFRLAESLGYRFVGFELGGRLEMALWAGLSFGQAFGSGSSYVLNFDGTFGADIEVWDGGDLSLVATPMLSLGAVVLGANGFDPVAGFHVQFAAQAELVMASGLVGVWLRPLVFDGFVRDGGFGAYSLLAGVDFHF